MSILLCSHLRDSNFFVKISPLQYFILYNSTLGTRPGRKIVVSSGGRTNGVLCRSGTLKPCQFVRRNSQAKSDPVRRGSETRSGTMISKLYSVQFSLRLRPIHVGTVQDSVVKVASGQ